MTTPLARFLLERKVRAENRARIGQPGTCLSCGKLHPQKLTGFRCRSCKANGIRPESWGPSVPPGGEHFGGQTCGVVNL